MHLNSFKWLSWAVAFAFITLISTKRKICFFLFSGCVEIKKFTSLMRIKRKKCESCGITVKSVTQWIQNDTYRNATNFHLWCNKSASAKWSSHSKLLTEQLWSLKMMFLLKLFSFFPRCDWKFIFMIIGSKYCVYATIDRFFFILNYLVQAFTD